MEGVNYRLISVIQTCLFSPTIVDRPSNDYETVGNIKVVSVDSFKQLEVSKKVDYATKLPVLTQGSFYFIKQRS